MPHTNAKYRIDMLYHMDWVRLERCTGMYDMPVLERERYVPASLTALNEAMRLERRNTGVHFFIDDYQFERFWTRPTVYVQRMKEFECMLTPDFSLLTDMPEPMKLWNVFRSRLIGQHFQEQGCRVIPTVSWAEPASFRYCFDGLPAQGTVAVGSIGVHRDPVALAAWHRGMDAMLERLEPTEILFYGLPVQRDYGSARVFWYYKERYKRLGKEAEAWADGAPLTESP